MMLDEIKTIVILQFENRSFDHILGHLSFNNFNPEVDGLKQDLSQYQNLYKGDGYIPFQFKVDTDLTDDLPHEYNEVATQLAWSDVKKQFLMNGFVEAYANKTGRSPNPQNDAMGFFGAEQVPITHFLASNYCVCDRWHCPFPSSTQPNRTMALCGDSSIYRTKLQLISAEGNIFDWMNKAGVRWRVYHDGLSFFILYPSLWGHVLGDNFSDYENLYKDFQQEPDASFPQVILVEPSYQDSPHLGPDHPNDNHAPLAIGWGEDFLRRTYEAVIANPARWGNTLMVVFSDEHGGFYDHVAPPPIGYTTKGDDAHTFTSLGPRIPGLIISPFVKPGQVCHQLLDHTSVLQLLAEKFTPGQPYSATVEERRKNGINSVTAALDTTLTRVAPAPPQQKIMVSSALGDKIDTAPDTEPMRQSFEGAAMDMLTARPADTAKKYPELLQWRDVVTKARAAGSLLITVYFVVFSFVACKKSSGPVFTADVYVAGNLSGTNGPQAIYWKNNVSYPLVSPNQHGLVNAITVSGMDIYIAGETFNSTDSFVTTYWKNGAATTLSVPGTNGQANSIAVSGANVYVAGFTVNSRVNGISNPVPLLWKNNVADTLPLPGSYGQPMSVAVAGNDVFVTGNGTNVPNAVYWKNGAVAIVSRGYTFASGIAVSGSDVYVVGYTYSANGSGAISLIPSRVNRKA